MYNVTSRNANDGAQHMYVYIHDYIHKYRNIYDYIQVCTADEQSLRAFSNYSTLV